MFSKLLYHLGVSQCSCCEHQEHEVLQVGSKKIQIHCSGMKAHCPEIIIIIKTSVFRAFRLPVPVIYVFRCFCNNKQYTVFIQTFIYHCTRILHLMIKHFSVAIAT